MTLYLRGRPLPITEVTPLGMGAEGVVFGAAGTSRFCFKAYRNPSPARDMRTAALLRMPPVNWSGTDGHHAAWPLGSLTDENGHVRVVVMRRADGPSMHALFDPSQRSTALAAPTWATLLRVAREVARLFAELHRIGVVIGDVSPNNLLVDRNGRVVLIDCDSVQFTDPVTGHEFVAENLTPEYAAPESVRDPAPEHLPRLAKEHDLFGLAVLICQLLMEGDHPFEGLPVDGSDQGIEANIRNDNCRLLRPERFVPVPGQLTLDLLPAPVSALVQRAFADGHSDASCRPTTADWETALTSALNDLIGCRNEPEVHFYRQGLDTCVWCYRRKAGLGDHYPSTGDRRTRPAAPAHDEALERASAVPGSVPLRQGEPVETPSSRDRTHEVTPGRDQRQRRRPDPPPSRRGRG